MIKVSDCVFEIISTSDIAQVTLQAGILNLTSYARTIQSQVEEMAKKKVEINSIVVALSRLSKKAAKIPAILPQLQIDELNIDAPLSDITYEKTAQTVKLANSFFQKTDNIEKSFKTVVEGDKEITFVLAQKLKSILLDHFQIKPKAAFDDLVGISLSFSPRYIQEPNIIFAILHKLAIKRVNIIEIISTFSEISVVIRREELNTAMNQLKELFPS